MIIKDKSGLNFKINKENLTAKVINSPLAKGDVFIPSFVNHQSQKYFITEICENSFKNNEFIETINFPEDSKVISIGTDAFFGSSLNTIYFPPSLEELKEGWCRYAKYLTKITVSSSNKIFLLHETEMILGKSDPNTNDYDILYYAPRNIETVIIPSSIKYINSYAFANCIFLSTITIPDQVKIIRKGAFYNCSNLRLLNISTNSQLTLIEEDAFFNSQIESIFIPSKFECLKDGWCNNTKFLIEILILEENDRFSLFDNMILSKSESNKDSFDVLCFASRSILSAKIPSTIKRISPFAFSSSLIQSIEFSEDSEIEIINKETFSYSKITEVVFPKSVKIIGERTFCHCDFLQKVEFTENSELRIIESGAFLNSSIEFLNIPAKFVEFRGSWCRGTPSLCKISVSPNNRRFGLLGEKIVIGKSETNDDDFDSIVFAPRDIINVSIPSKIKYINQYVFNDCKMLEKVEIGRNSKLEIIENGAFLSSSIQSIYIPRHLTRIGKGAFSDSKLETIQISRKSELQYIARYAFSNSLIRSISIPDTVTTINDSAFEHCSYLESITFSPKSELSLIGKNAFANTLITEMKIPDNVERICEGTFSSCKYFNKIEFTENSELRCICGYAFCYSNISTLYIPPKVKHLKEGCFNANHLSRISVSTKNKYFMDIDGKMVVGKSSIKNENYDILNFITCNAQDIVIPSFIKQINYASRVIFESSVNLTNITVSPDNKWFKVIDGKMLVGKSDIKQDKYDILYFVSRDAVDIQIPSYIKRINPYALNKCYHLNQVNFEPNSELEIICEYSFSELENLYTICIPDHVQTIEEYAFYHCNNLYTITFSSESELKCIKSNAFFKSGLNEITIPKNVEHINQMTFLYCDYLKKVAFAEGSQLKSIKLGAFNSTKITELNLPIHFNEFENSWNQYTRFLNRISIHPENNNFKLLDNQIVIGKTNSFSDTYDAIYFAPRDIKTVFIPSYIKHIKPYAFSGCFIHKIEFEENSKLEIIGKCAFMESSITEILIPSQIEKISKYAFSKSVIEKLEFADNSKLISIDSSAFEEAQIKNIKIPSNVRHIGSYAFNHCCELENVSFESNSQLRSIHFGAFSNTAITNISLPDKIQVVDESIFYDAQLRSIEFSENSELKRITQFLFATQISDFHIPPKVASIEKNAFIHSDDLTNITVSPDNKWFKVIDGKMLVGKSDIKQDKYDILYFVSRDAVDIQIPSYIKRINPYALNKCYHLNQVNFEPNSELEIICEYSFSQSNIITICIPDHVQTIEEDAFYDCRNLEEVIFTEKSELKIIGKFSFGRTKLNKITVPKSVTTICERSFSNCSHLKTIDIFEDSQLQSIGSFAFSNTLISSLFIPSKVSQLERGWCRWTKKLETVTISPNNQYYIDTNNHKYVLSKSDINSNDFDVLCFASRTIECVIVRPNIKRIDSYAFSDCCKIQSFIFDIDSKLESIGYESFSFSFIKYVDFPKSTKVIESSAFLGCENIRSVNFVEDSNIDIQNNAFRSSSLSSFVFPKGCNEIVYNQFADIGHVCSVEFLGDDVIIDVPRGYRMVASLISFPNAKRVRITGYLDNYHIKSIFVSPMTPITFEQRYY